jgi:hypothetical protein
MPEPKSQDQPLRRGFLRGVLVHTLVFGLVTTAIPIVLELVAGLLMDGEKVLRNLREHWLLNAGILTVVFLFASLVGSIRYSLARLLEIAGEGQARSDRNHFIKVLQRSRGRGELHANGQDESSAPHSDPLLHFLHLLGIVKRIGAEYSPVSLSGDSLLATMVAHLEDKNATFIGDWSAGSNSEEHKRLISLITSIEEWRIASSPQSNPSPARIVRAAIALIRADFAGEARFLMIKSPTWDPNGAWIPVMGSEEPADGQLRNTIFREIQEEMVLQAEDIIEIRELSEAYDQRISKRVGLSTAFTYSIFSVQLRQSSPSVKDFFVARPKRIIDYSKAVRIHEFIWLRWDELLSSPHLNAEMPTVINVFKQIDPASIPQTRSIDIPFQ